MATTLSVILPHDSPYRTRNGEDVSRELALLWAVNQSIDSLHPLSFQVLPWVAKLASPEELYFPEELATWFRHVARRETMEKAYTRHVTRTARVPATRGAPKAGRNDSCSCGSGKKFKKCCGG